MSSSKMFGPFVVGPNAQIERAANKSQSYFSRKKLPIDFFVHSDVDLVRFDVFGEVLFHWLTDHCQFILSVWRFGEALELGGFDYGFAKGDDRIGDLDVNVGVHFA